MQVGDHEENWPLRSNGFRRWLQQAYYAKAKVAANAQAIQDVIGVLEGKALFDGPEFQVYLRTAQHQGNVYLDLCNSDWQAVEITSQGWGVVNKAPVRFRRAKAMLPLPVPTRGGNLDSLRGLLNLGDDEWPLLLASLVASLRPIGPYPVLCLHGEQGSGKSSAARAMRKLIDPNAAPLRSEPRDARDLMVAANNGWVIALDNLSQVSPWLSDALCRLSTGGGFSTRELYSDGEEAIFEAQRPVMVNGIEELATRSDLIDRCLILNLPAIPEDRRRPEAELWGEFDRLAPGILGALLTAVANALRNLPNTKLGRLPRMADFALWTTAAETGLGLATGQIMAAYQGNRAEANELALEASPVGKAVLDFCCTTPFWTGTSTELLTKLDTTVAEATKRGGWPKKANSLSGILKRLAPNLRTAGVEVDLGGHTGRGQHKRRQITLRRVEENVVPCVLTVPALEKLGAWDGHGADSCLSGDDPSTTAHCPANPHGNGVGTMVVPGDDHARLRSFGADVDVVNRLLMEVAVDDGEGTSKWISADGARWQGANPCWRPGDAANRLAAPTSGKGAAREA